MIVRILIQDQAIYYLVYVSPDRDPSNPFDESDSAMSCSIINLVDYQTTSVMEDAVLNGLGSPTLQSIYGSRLFLNLKKAGEQNKFENSENVSRFISAMEFSRTALPQQQYGEPVKASNVNHSDSESRVCDIQE